MMLDYRISQLLSTVGLLTLLLAGACQSPFARTGPKFDARKPKAGTVSAKAGAVTNFTSVEFTNQVTAELLQPGGELFTLGPGDRIELEILGDPSTRTIVTVGPDGKIYFYLLPGIDVWGLSMGQAKAL